LGKGKTRRDTTIRIKVSHLEALNGGGTMGKIQKKEQGRTEGNKRRRKVQGRLPLRGEKGGKQRGEGVEKGRLQGKRAYVHEGPENRFGGNR